MLLISFEEGDLDEEELLLLYLAAKDDVMNSLLPPLRLVGRRLCIKELDQERCLRRFRLRKEEVYDLREALEMPEKFTSPCRVRWSSMDDLQVLLRRLTYPARLGDRSV